MGMEEKLYTQFKAERDFFGRAQIIRSFTAQKNPELDSEYFTEMFSYFTGYLKTSGQVSREITASYLLVKELAGRYPHLASGIKLNFTDIFNEIEDPGDLFVSLKDAKFREDFLSQIQLFVPNWSDIFIKLFPKCPLTSIIAALQKEGCGDKLTALTAGCFDNYREYKEAIVWLFRNSGGEAWYENAGIPFEKQLITLIHILDLTYRDIDNRRDTAENRRINKQVYTILFKDGVIGEFIGEDDIDTIIRIYSFLNDVKNLDPADKLALKNRILSKHPDFKFFGDEEKKVQTLGLLVTHEKYLEKQRQQARIISEDIPANSKELEFAKSLGDLRENAEYKAALEKQAILNSTLAKLSEEISRAQLFDPSTVSTSRVSFGTKVTLLNRGSGKKETYTILGPWESDPDNGIISYLSPFAGAMMGKPVGEEIVFSLNEEKVTYKVESITAAI
jgi:transcription elongation factor GreA